MRAALVATLLLAAAPLQSRATPTANASAVQSPARAVPGHGSAWSFAILGDNRDDPDSVFPTIVQRIHADGDLAFVIHLGDTVRSGGQSQLQDFLKIATPIRGCFFPVIGNHEIRRDKDRRDYKAAFGLKSTSYSFTYRNVHVAVVDDASQEFSDGVLTWLRSDLEAHKRGAAGIERVFVAMHIPPAGFGISTYVEGDKAQRFEAGSSSLLELLRAYSADAIFAGHIHRAQTIDVPGHPQLVISGAAGAPQYGTPHPRYGYHRLIVNGADVRAEFVEVTKGQHALVEHARSRQATCPTVANSFDR